MDRHGTHVPDGRDGRLGVGEGMISSECPCGIPHAGLEEQGEETRSMREPRHRHEGECLRNCRLPTAATSGLGSTASALVQRECSVT